ncbi:hypothetical protein IKG60_01720 [Candidatus Saccharibacteria bacterium]|nr:hypothetical protein [Candidatus Saccharibacteria bacterium]
MKERIKKTECGANQGAGRGTQSISSIAMHEAQQKAQAEKTEHSSVLEIIAMSRASMVTAGVALAACLLAGGFLVMPLAMADNSAVDNVQITVPPSCTMGGEVNTPHSTSLISGQSQGNIGQTTLKAWCNDAAGYSIYAVGAGDNEDGNTKMISSIKPDYDIQTGTNVGSGNSSWAMKLTAGSVTNPDAGVSSTPPSIVSGYNAYHAVPNTYTQVAYRTSGTDMETDVTKSGSYITTTYQVYANATQPAGTYVGQVKYAMVHPYDAEASTLKSLYKVFQETYGETNKMKVQDSDTKSYYTMQSMTSAICNATTMIGEASQVQLIDARDKSLYWVTKLEDGHCWMTQNLDLDLDSNGTLALNSNNTDLNQYGENNYDSSNGYSQDNGVITWVPERSTVTTLSESTWINDNNNPYSYDIGKTTVSDSEGSADGHRLNGNYYNWTAAIASNDSSSFDTPTYNDPTANPQNSICPKSWRLPTISNDPGTTPGSTNEFRRLNILYNSNSTDNASGLISAPLYLSRSGRVDGGSLLGAGGGGNYWSSTVYSSEGARRLNFAATGVLPENNFYRYSGFSLRCVAR